jgi:hypothetical protein
MISGQDGATEGSDRGLRLRPVKSLPTLRGRIFPPPSDRTYRRFLPALRGPLELDTPANTRCVEMLLRPSQFPPG